MPETRDVFVISKNGDEAYWNEGNKSAMGNV
jgi:hypothetical protein